MKHQRSAWEVEPLPKLHGEHRFYPGGNGEPSKALDPYMPLGLPGVGMLPSSKQQSMQRSGEQCEVSVRGHSSAAGTSLPVLTPWKASSCCRVPVLRLPVVGGKGSRLFF